MPVQVPPLEAALATLAASLSDLQLRGLRDATDEEVSLFHFAVGVRVREALRLWQDSALAQWFRAEGVARPDDMSHELLLRLRSHLRS
jgi:hypothetical protein